jgi:CheY-like chemotaxis protein
VQANLEIKRCFQAGFRCFRRVDLLFPFIRSLFNKTLFHKGGVMEQRRLILCIDQIESCEIMEILFRRIGFQVMSLQSAKDALQLAHQHSFSAVVSEYLLDDISGEEFCSELKKQKPDLPLIFFSAESREEYKERMLSAGANAYLVKPNDLDQIEMTVMSYALA